MSALPLSMFSIRRSPNYTFTSGYIGFSSLHTARIVCAVATGAKGHGERRARTRDGVGVKNNRLYLRELFLLLSIVNTISVASGGWRCLHL